MSNETVTRFPIVDVLPHALDRLCERYPALCRGKGRADLRQAVATACAVGVRFVAVRDNGAAQYHVPSLQIDVIARKCGMVWEIRTIPDQRSKKDPVYYHDVMRR